MKALTHKALIASLTSEQRAELTHRTNADAGWHLLVYLSLIGVLIALIHMRVVWWPVLLMPLGVLLVFLFTLMHETTHRTAFAGRWVNDVVARCCGWVLFLPPQWFRYFHFAHHRFTQDPERDPELVSPRPASLAAYLWHISGLPVTYSLMKTLWVNAAGRELQSFVPISAKAAIVRESKLMLMSYLAVVVIAIAIGALEFLFFCWWLPLMLGQPFLRLYLMAEHGRCPYVDNMFANTRTVFTHWLVCKLAWNMPFHAEHHAYPNVPFHRLPAFHELVKHRLLVTANGYSAFHREVIKAHTQKTDAR